MIGLADLLIRIAAVIPRPQRKRIAQSVRTVAVVVGNEPGIGTCLVLRKACQRAAELAVGEKKLQCLARKQLNSQQ